MKKIAILGSTGSIGTQTLEVVRANKDIEVTALAAGSNIDLLEKQIREFSPKHRGGLERGKSKRIERPCAQISDIRVESGMDGLLAVATEQECGDCGDSGSRNDRYPPDDRSDGGWKRYCTCKQRDPGNGRAYHHVAGKGEACPDSAGGQRAQRDFPEFERRDRK